MLILAFDLATCTGWAVGSPGRIPHSGAWRLRKTEEPRGLAGANLIREAEALINKHGRPDYIAKEKRLSLAAMTRKRNGPANIEIQIGLHAVVEAFCILHQIEFRDIDVNQGRKQFLGQSHYGERADTKRAVVARCQLMKFMARSQTNDNQADAICTWWTACTELAFGPKVLYMFNERP